MKRWIAHLAAAVIALTLLGQARPGAGLSCPTPEGMLPKMDLIIEGKITAISGPGEMRFTVTRYYKGTGPALLEATVEGWSEHDFRMNGPDQVPRVGDTVLAGFRREDARLRSGLCDPFTLLRPGRDAAPEVRALLGPGHDPDGDPSPAPEERPSTAPWLLTGAVVVLGAAGFIIWRRRRARKQP